jgi:Predicted periplasmic or secreted lipoprotein
MKSKTIAQFALAAMLLGIPCLASAADVERIVVLESDRVIIDSVTTNIKDMDGTFSVDADNGKVTLVGVVKDKTTMDRIVSKVNEIPGVKSVDNELRVDPAYASMNTVYQYPHKADRTFTPDEMATNVRYSLRPYAQVTSRTEDGIVVLTGFVPTAADKTRAARLASQVPGVQGVRNDLVVQ